MRTFRFCVLVATMATILGVFSNDTVAQSNRGQIVDASAPEGKFVINGKYWALLIGIEKYDDPKIAKLDTPVNDVNALAQILKTQYGFEEEQMTILLNETAKRANIEDRLYDISRLAKAEDSVLIYFAGHGDNDQTIGRGFWIPSDGKPGSPGTWINNASIRDVVNEMKARHVYVVADSCFSGTLFAANRSISPPEDGKYFQRLHLLKSRWGLASGGNEPVADGGKDNHSIFAYFFLKLLKDNERTYLTPAQISVELPELVSRNAAQTPVSRPLQSAGDAGGQFIFFRNSGRQSPAPKAEWRIPVKSIHPPHDQRGGTQAQWDHSPIGYLPIPYDWFEVLLSDPAFAHVLYGIGMLPDDSQTGGLPFGMTKIESSVSSQPLVGVTCAFCHTSKLAYKGVSYRIEGGASFAFLNQFMPLVSNALAAKISSANFPDFATKVFARQGRPITEENLSALRNEVRSLIKRSSSDYAMVGWGPGRYDLFGQATNMTSVGLDGDNYRPPNAPVSIPPVWGASDYDLVLWNTSNQDSLSRNLMHVLALNAPIIKDAKLEFSVDVQSLADLVDAVKKVRPPRWPKEFPPINRELALRGKELYHGAKAKGIPSLCAHCHVPSPILNAPSSGPHLHIQKVRLSQVKTDPVYVQNIVERRVNLEMFNAGTKFATQILDFLATELMGQSGLPGNLEGQGETGRSSNAAQYQAPPLLGIWATAPFLHNGSIPSLYDLLSPPSERPTCFYLRSGMEFDPERVGYVHEKCGSNLSSGFAYITDRFGNSNEGHEFKNSKGCLVGGESSDQLGCEITVWDRFAIIEYLKTCDLEPLILPGSPVCRDLE